MSIFHHDPHDVLGRSEEKQRQDHELAQIQKRASASTNSVSPTSSSSTPANGGLDLIGMVLFLAVGGVISTVAGVVNGVASFFNDVQEKRTAELNAISAVHQELTLGQIAQLTSNPNYMLVLERYLQLRDDIKSGLQFILTKNNICKKTLTNTSCDATYETSYSSGVQNEDGTLINNQNNIVYTYTLSGKDGNSTTINLTYSPGWGDDANMRLEVSQTLSRDGADTDAMKHTMHDVLDMFRFPQNVQAILYAQSKEKLWQNDFTYRWGCEYETVPDRTGKAHCDLSIKFSELKL